MPKIQSRAEKWASDEEAEGKTGGLTSDSEGLEDFEPLIGSDLFTSFSTWKFCLKIKEKDGIHVRGKICF